MLEGIEKSKIKAEEKLANSSEELVLSSNLDSSKEEVKFPPSTTLRFSSSLAEIKAVKEFRDLMSIGSHPPKARLSQFVMILGAPDLPRMHPGVDDRFNPNKSFDYEWKDLMERGKVTLKTISSKTMAKKPCKKLLLLRGSVDEGEDDLTKSIHTGHTLDQFSENIRKENQHPIEFHFAGHGTPEKIGPLSHDKRLKADDFAELFDHLVEASGLKESLRSKKKLIFVFHTCNSAYVDTSDIPSRSSPAEIQERVKAKIISDSIIGKFYQAMIQLGFDNIKVVGYRGFYQAMLSGNGIRVVNSLNSSDKNFVEVDSAKVMHSIERTARGEDLVSLPLETRYTIMPVNIDSVHTHRNGIA